MKNQFTEKLLEKSFEKVCCKRRNDSSSSDIWDLKLNWNLRKKKLLDELNAGTYRFDAVKEVRYNGQVYEIWTSEDSSCD